MKANRFANYYSGGTVVRNQFLDRRTAAMLIRASRSQVLAGVSATAMPRILPTGAIELRSKDGVIHIRRERIAGR
jgi:hypothetical protein